MNVIEMQGSKVRDGELNEAEVRSFIQQEGYCKAERAKLWKKHKDCEGKCSQCPWGKAHMALKSVNEYQDAMIEDYSWKQAIKIIRASQFDLGLFIDDVVYYGMQIGGVVFGIWFIYKFYVIVKRLLGY